MTAPAKLPFEVVRARRAGARLAAVQALYSMEQTGRSARAVIAEFRADRLGLGPDGAPVEEADPDLFGSVVNNVVDRQADVDAAIAGRLSAGWKLTRVDALSRALLRAATGEFLGHESLSAAIIIDEYVSLAADFFGDGAEVRFINGILDNLGEDLRANR